MHANHENRIYMFLLASILVIVGQFLAIAMAAPVSGALAQTRLSYRVGFEQPKFPVKKAMNRRYRHVLKRYSRRIKQRDIAGNEAHCSKQILREAHWLVNYTPYTDRIERRINDLHDSLEKIDQSFASEQTPEDGSWGTCYEEWFLRLSSSVDPLKELNFGGRRAQFGLRFLERIDTPEELTKTLEDILVSSVAEGLNHRKELNLVSSALGQLLLLPRLAALFDPEFPREQLAAAFIEFMDERWQNPNTGYFGAWYASNGKIVKTDDLSVTFHMVSYRNGKINLLRKIVDTTFDLRETRYPFGWHDRGVLNNHHNYDVTRLLRYGWPYMTDNQKARTRAEIAIMLARSLRLTIDGQGAFKGDAYDSMADAYYFGASFLDEAGYFRKSRRFWGRYRTFPGAEDVRRRLVENLKVIGSEDPMAIAAMRKLSATD